MIKKRLIETRVAMLGMLKPKINHCSAFQMPITTRKQPLGGKPIEQDRAIIGREGQ